MAKSRRSEATPGSGRDSEEQISCVFLTLPLSVWSERLVVIYTLKGQVLHHLVEAGVLVGGKYHRFEFGIYAEVLEGRGYRFHRPCPQREPGEGDLIESGEAKPKEAGEPTVEIAYEVVEKFLADKERVAVYQWPPKARRRRRDDDDFEDDDGDGVGL